MPQKSNKRGQRLNHNRALELLKYGRPVTFEGPGGLSVATYLLRQLAKHPGALFNLDFKHEKGCNVEKGGCSCEPNIVVQRAYGA
jgi:hypothetical protein